MERNCEHCLNREVKVVNYGDLGSRVVEKCKLGFVLRLPKPCRDEKLKIDDGWREVEDAFDKNLLGC